MNRLAFQPVAGLPLVLLVALALRLLWAVLIPVEPMSDSIAYDILARMIVDHGVYGFESDAPSAYWAVGTSAIVAATYAILGETYLGVVALNLVAGVGAIVFVYHLGRLYFGPAVGLLAAVAMAVWPNLIFFTTILSSELFFMFLTVGGLYFWESARDGRHVNMLACGLFWAAACYVRPVIVLLPLALLLASISGGPSKLYRDLGKMLVALGIIVVLVLPWSYRNYLVFNEFMFVSSNFGPNFWMGNNPDTSGGYMPLPDHVAGLSEPARAAMLMDEALAHIADHPMAFVGRTLWKAGVLHSWETVGVVWNEAALFATIGSLPILFLKLVSTGYWYLVLAAALFGVGVVLKRDAWRALFHPAFGGWAYFTAIHAVIVVGDRYHMPNVPFMAIYAGVGLVAVIRYLPVVIGESTRLQPLLGWFAKLDSTR
jgi:4-amino-4-deoxy-L-arabinose transferase-like glycosyltransferase